MEPPIDWWRFVMTLAAVGAYAKLWVIGRDVADMHALAFPFRRSREATSTWPPTCRRCGLPFSADELDENGECSGCFSDRGETKQ
jgi:predicted Zn-ribbon and HTH transcriptional regulator